MGGRDKATRKSARYREILEVVRERIFDGTYPVDGTLPSETEFCREFEASRFTIREALRRLQSEGLVSRQQGAGSTVMRNSPGGAFVQSCGSVDQLLQFAQDTDYRLVTVEPAPLDERRAARLGAASGEIWHRQRGLRLQKSPQAVLAVVDSYLPPDCEPHLPALADQKPPLYAYLERITGHVVTDVLQEVQSVEMPADIAELMGVPPGTLSLCILRRYQTEHGTLIASFNWHPGGDEFIYHTRLKHSTLADPNA